MQAFKLIDFDIFDDEYSSYAIDSDSDSDHEDSYAAKCIIRMYGIDEHRKTHCTNVTGYKPHFYIRVSDNWSSYRTRQFKQDISKRMGYYRNTINDCRVVERKTLYGFDNDSLHRFMYVSFHNMRGFNKMKGFFCKYEDEDDDETKEVPDQYDYDSEDEVFDQLAGPVIQKRRKQVVYSLLYDKIHLQVYEANIPPLLRFFHILDIKPAGWVEVPTSTSISDGQKSNCDYEYILDYKEIKPLPDKNTSVPYTICSFDIEALSSHGDFPVAKKTYKKLATQIMEYWETNDIDSEYKNATFNLLIHSAYSLLESNSHHVDDVHVKDKSKINKEYINGLCEKLLNAKVMKIIESKRVKRDIKIENLTKMLDKYLPPLEGDIVTFIGSTFLRNGEREPYLNHCIALHEAKIENKPENTVLECYDKEEDVLLAWRDIICEQDPDIIIGYNIFGFDYKFMVQRANELRICPDFLDISRTLEHVCGNRQKNGTYKVKESSISIASGTHETSYIRMPGRIQVDLYNYFRRGYNLESYKLDHVAGNFIRNKIHSYQDGWLQTTIDHVLHVGSYIHIEEIGHSSDYIENGAKFKIIEMDTVDSRIRIDRSDLTLDFKKKVMWCLAKDDVSPQEIFRLTRDGDVYERGVIAKYCIQDCNLVHHLFKKIDIVTEFVEMANLCYVPIEFLILRGQGIKLFSFITKNCREVNTVLPVRNKGDNSGYEGAIVLNPKCGLYLDEPVACVDYSSLYPSSMISENLSHDSKVWSKEYDLEGKLIKEEGEKDENGEHFIYDNLDNMEYVDVEFDTYRYVKKSTSVTHKVKVGSKKTRWAQFKDRKAILPTILETLLNARKNTRKQAKFKTVHTSIGDYTGTIMSQENEQIVLRDTRGDVKVIEKESALSIQDTYDSFMKNVLDKRQLAIKVTANSLYGQCGAKTSDFYEQDVAAATTAIGRKLLTYGKRVIEDVYGDRVCETKYGKVHSHAEYIYGDSVTGDTPIMLRYFNLDKTCDMKLIRIDELCDSWIPYRTDFKPFDSLESNRRDKQESSYIQYHTQVWTKSGWSDIHKVIRHKCNKTLYRISTNKGIVDVTEDHSLLDQDGNITKPSEVCVGQELLHRDWNDIIEDKRSYMDLIRIHLIGKNIMDSIHWYKKGHKQSITHSKYYLFGILSQTLSSKDNTYYLEFTSMDDAIHVLILLRLAYSDSFRIEDSNEKHIIYLHEECILRDISHMYNNHYDRIVPYSLLNDNEWNIKNYIAGLISVITKEEKNIIDIPCRTKLFMSGLSHLFNRIGIYTKTQDDCILTVGTINKEEKCLITKIEHLGETDDFVYDIETKDGTFNCGFPWIIKNTDSVFMSFKLTDIHGKKIIGEEALKHTIELAKEAGKVATMHLKGPHDLEYEKTFMPFCLLSKKRYVGMLYEDDIHKCYRKSMGIVLKRRDNAPIVKDVYGGIIDILMKDKNVTQAIRFGKKCIHDILKGKYGLEKLIITKSLRDYYKNPAQIAHKVLADRIGMRDIGNKPRSGDRIPYVYIVKSNFDGKKLLQGDKIEHPDYVRQHNLQPDYMFYITNQIMKPILQVFSLVLEEFDTFSKKKKHFIQDKKLLTVKYKDDENKLEEKIQDLREKYTKGLLFDDTIKASMDSFSNNVAKKMFIAENYKD